jgi:hypothetical protein
LAGDEVTSEETVRAIKGVINHLGGAFMTAPATLERGRVLGYQGWAFYTGGRGGVLGDVHSDVVQAAFFFFPAWRIHRAWANARSVAPPEQTTAAYAECCAAWGREQLAGKPGLAGFCELAERVVDSADVAGMPLFAGWRAVPRPEDPPARAALLLQALREHRGGAHSAAVLAGGLTPLEAILAGPGPENASFFGWEEPYPDTAHLAELRRRAETATDEIAARAYRVLTDEERKELARNVVEWE